jgi:uncharacterized membrane protein YphA (DoxX/SURF4 family)
MTTKAKRTTGWIITGLVGLFMIGASGIGKFFDYPGKAEQLAKLEFPASLLTTVACIEIAVTLLYLIPRTAFLGAILLSAYLGGAVWTHLRIGDPWFFPIIIGVLAWTGLALRQPAIVALSLGKNPPSDGTRQSA